MTLEILQNEMISAMKNKDKLRKDVLSSLVDAVKKASITSKGRVEITEALIDGVMLKEQKTVQEMIDSCPQSRAELLAEYNAKLAIINEFTPVLMDSAAEISRYVTEVLQLEWTKANRGKIMAGLKGKADLKVANQLFR